MTHRSTVWILVAVLVLGAVPAAYGQSVTMRDDQVLKVSWTECTNICDQPAGTAEFRVFLDGAPLAPVVPPTMMRDFGPLLGVGVHTLEIQPVNSIGTPGGEQPAPPAVVRVTVTPARPGPPVTPVVTVEVITP